MKRLFSIPFIFATVVMFTACQKDEEPVDALPEPPAKEQRYYDEVFDVEVIANVKFGEAVQPVPMNPENVQELFLDIYQPMGDQASARPVIVLAFGGALFLATRRVLTL